MASFIEVEDTGIYIGSESVGTRALNAVSRIDGVTDVRVQEEGDTRATIAYEWGGREKFDRIDDVLKLVGLRKVGGGGLL